MEILQRRLKTMDIKAKAKELGIEITDEMTDDEIKALVEAKEEELKNKNKDPEYLENELKKVIAQRDAAKKERRALQNKIKEFEEKMKSLPPSDELTKMKEEYEALKEFKTQVEKEREEKELAQKTELERTQIQFKKEMESLQEQFNKQLEELGSKVKEKEEILQKKDNKIATLRTYRLEREIIENASQKAYNPKQVVKLLRDGFEYDENLDKFYYPVYDQSGKMVDELTIEDRVKQFLDDPENDNLVRSDANTNSMHTKPADDPSKRTYSGVYNPNDPKIKEEAAAHNMDPKDWVEIAELRDRKLGKLKDE